MTQIQEMILLEDEDNGNRSAWTDFWNSVGKGVSQFFTYENPIKGTIYYILEGTEIPAYGTKFYLTSLGEISTHSDKNGEYDLGTKKDSIGLCTIWLDYENDACKFSNILNVAPRTLVKTDYPSKLKNLKIEYVDSYSNSKVAICSELMSRWEEEKKNPNINYTLPKAIVWTLEDDKASSAPCFNKMGANLLPDILLTGVKPFTIDKLRTLHHEYSHFIHFNYTENVNNFWGEVIFSEINSTLYDKSCFDELSTEGVKLINALLNLEIQDPNENFVSIYDFANPYVCFAENFAEWYMTIGIKKGGYAKKNNYNAVARINTYDNVGLLQAIETYLGAKEIVNLIRKKKITTFRSFYKELIDVFDEVKITKIFDAKYKPHGNPIR